MHRPAFYPFPGLFCASALFIISHFQEFVVADLDGLSDEQKIEAAAAKIITVYRKRVSRYLLCLYSLLAGVICLMISVVIYLITIS